MKIVFVGTLASSFIMFRRELALLLLSKGHQVFFLYSQADSNELNCLNDLGVVSFKYSLYRSGLNPIRDLFTFLNLLIILRRVDPDVVFSYFVKPVIYGTLAAFCLRVKLRVAMLEGLGVAFTKQPGKVLFKLRFVKFFQSLLYQVILPLCTHLIFLNIDDKEEVIDRLNISVANLLILGPIGVSLPDFQYIPPPKNSVSFLFIGRLLKEKGVCDFLSAAEIVKSSNKNVCFTLIGSADSTSPNVLSPPRLSSLINRQVIKYIPHTHDISGFFANSSVFVLPSYREGFSRSIQEAMAAGRPVITYDVPGCRQSVIDGVNGFICKPFDINGLVSRMRWFVEHDDQIHSMGLSARYYAMSNFDVNDANNRLTNFIFSTKGSD